MLNAGGVNIASAFLDDFTVRGIADNWRQCWGATLRVMEILV